MSEPGERSAEESAEPAALGVVTIGRNEGIRLLRSLDSVGEAADAVVYVDSGSSDGSAQAARDRGFDVVELDDSLPFSAARARNAGLARLTELRPELALVQFVDGDCELHPDWLEAAAEYLLARPEVALVAGRLRERHPEASAYHRLAQLEWDEPAGEVTACGGLFMASVAMLRKVGGFDAAMIAGEEPELCLRIRRAGGRIHRIEPEMAWHDTGIMRFGQWWRRQVRAGHSYAEQLHLQGRRPESQTLRSVISIFVWGGGLPLGCALLAGILSPAWLAPLAGYGVLWARLYRSRAQHGALYASACTVGKFGECLGALRFVWTRLVLGRGSQLIEYKPAS